MLIQAKNLTLDIGQQHILHDVTVNIARGEMIGLIGPNGAGKTSLLKILANIQTHYHGEYLYHNKPVQAYSRQALAKSFGYLAQDATAHWPLTVKTLIELGRLPFQGIIPRHNASDLAAVMIAAKLTEVEHLLHRVVTELSGGERARVLLARLLAAEPNVIFLDEPIAALDPYHQLHIMEILKAHTTNGGTVVIVLHDLNLAARFCDRLILMDQGAIVAEGNIEQLLQNRLLEETYGIELKMFCQDDAYSLTPWQRKIKPALLPDL